MINLIKHMSGLIIIIFLAMVIYVMLDDFAGMITGKDNESDEGKDKNEFEQ